MVGVHVDEKLCYGCGACVNICPGDLLYLDENGRTKMREQADCWDCMACVKSCPAGALETYLPYSLAECGARLIPKVTETEVRWKCIYPDGREEEFVIPR